MLFLQTFPLKFFPTHQTPLTLFSGLASDKGGTDKIAIFQAVGLAIKFVMEKIRQQNPTAADRAESVLKDVFKAQ